MNSPGHIPVSNTDMKKSNLKQKKPTRSDPPVARSGVQRSKTPAFGNSNNNSGITIRRREFVGTATNGATTNFVLSSLSASTPGYDINPSCTVLFPWLSHVATSYERYRYRSLKFEMIPSQATTSPGRYYCAVDYDYDDAPSSSKQELMGNLTASEAPVWEKSILVCDPACLNRDLPYRYVSCSTRGYDFEPRTTFAGFFMIAFDTTTANCLIDIWVDYEVELVTPVFESTNSLSVPVSGHTQMTNVTTAAGTAYFGAMNATAPTKSGLINKITSGLGNVPAMNVTVGGVSKSVLDGLDISLTGFRGAIDLIADVAATGVTPLSILGANQLDFRVGCFDSSGSYIGDAYYSTTQAIKQAGPKVLSEISTNDKYTTHVISIGLEELRKYMPNTRYLMPWLTSTLAAIGAGFQAFGWQHKDL